MAREGLLFSRIRLSRAPTKAPASEGRGRPEGQAGRQARGSTGGAPSNRLLPHRLVDLQDVGILIEPISVLGTHALLSREPNIRRDDDLNPPKPNGVGVARGAAQDHVHEGVLGLKQFPLNFKFKL